MRDPHAEGAAIPVPLRRHNELQRGTAFRQAPVLERRELLEASHHQQGAANPGGIRHEPHGLSGHSLSQEGERIGDESEQRPDEQIRTDEDPGRDKCLLLSLLSCVHTRKHEDHRGRRR